MLHDILLKRLRAEYLDMPGLRLTLPQAQRLCCVERAECEAVFNVLVSENFLYKNSNGTYGRITDGEPSAEDSYSDSRLR